MEQKPIQIGFIGFGLIGGTIAKALKRKAPEKYRITAYDPDTSALDAAVLDRVVDIPCKSLCREALGMLDFLFLCAPVTHNTACLPAVSKLLKEDCILTDVGSVKGSIHREIKALGLEQRFIGGHPMAGSERFGYQNSDYLLIENAYYIMTKTDKTAPQAIKRYQDIILDMNAIPVLMTAKEHDYATAAISHLPHLIAAALVNLAEASDGPGQWMKLLAAGGFKDLTRIASSSPVMWEQIFLENKENILELLSAYTEQLEKWRESIEKDRGADLRKRFEKAGEYRSGLSAAASGPVNKEHLLYSDIRDESGAIATIAAILAKQSISLKNIGIVHNREFEQGVLRMEFYQADALCSAAALLAENGYRVYHF